jgi:hypothetical protein
MKEVLESQLKYAPQVYQAELQYQPLYAQLQAQTQGYLANQAIEQAKALYPEVAKIEAGYNEANRAAEIQQLGQALPQYQQALEGVTPGYTETLKGMGDLARQQSQEALNAPQLTNYAAQIQGPTAGQFVGGVQNYQPGSQMRGVGMAREAGFMRGVSGPELQSSLGQVNQGLVNQYVQSMPGMEETAARFGDIANQELAAGRSLSAEEQRMADQAARSAYAARGTALGNQAIGAEILNRADVANQRFQQRLQNAAGAAGQVQNIYTPALQQAFQRQAGAEGYNLSAQGQAFGQAQARENLAQQIQQQRYTQGMGREQLLGSAQQQAYAQAMGREDLARQTQQSAFQQALQRQQGDVALQQGATAIQAGKAQLAAGSLAGMQQAQAPMLQAFYKQPILAGQSSFAQQMGLGSQQAMGPQFFNPESPTGMGSIYGAYNAQMGLAGANAQANAAKSAGAMGMAGSIIGGGMTAGAIIF